MNDKIKIVILAAGKGKRMMSELPKVLAKVNGKSMVAYVAESVRKSGLDNRPIIVVGYKKELVMTELGDEYEYVEQNEQLGTGHAVMCAQDYLENKAENIIVLYGDNPFLSNETIKKLAETHILTKRKITMITTKLPDFEDWRSFFYTNFSRIVRDGDGNILKSVEFKDATDKEKEIKEVNPCYFCFDAKWLWSKLKTLQNNNAQKEYYLTDLVKRAMEDKEPIGSMTVDPREALAANSKEELEILENMAI